MIRNHCSVFMLIFATPAISQDIGQEAFLQLSIVEQAELQLLFKSAGIYDAKIDGKWGPATERALRIAHERLSDVGILYDLQLRQSTEAFYVFLLSDAGYYFLVPEGEECDGCGIDETAEVSSDSVLRAGLFTPLSQDGYSGVRLEDVSYYTGRTGICRATLGKFSDGIDLVEVSAWRRYDGWGFDVTSEHNIAPPLTPPDPFFGDVLPMNGVFERRGSQWISSFVNSDPYFMDRLGNRTAIKLSTNQGGSANIIEIPFLPQVVADFLECAQFEEERHWQRYCLETIPTELRMPSTMPFCSSYWD